PTEQALYDQLDPALDLCQSGQMADLVIQTANWCQNLVWRPEDPAAACAALAAQTLDEMRAMEEQYGSPVHVLVTAAAARLPGLVPLLNEALWQPTAEEVVEMTPSSDFGDGLMQDDPPPLAHAPLTVLPGGSAALAAHALVVRLYRGELPCGAVSTVPLPEPQPNDAGLVRLHFEGQDYPLSKTAFTLGRHPDCDIVFESEQYPTVSAHHCEIAFDRQVYVLHDHSRNGTLVNERPIMDEMPLQPGDWIRLGPGGPLLQFLGQPSEQRRAMRSG
ncbi:MAG TPA: FHA domain-containing protein, partial [Gemmataceae bacterium]